MVDGGPWFPWLLIGVLGLGVYALRLSFIGLEGVVEGLSPGVERALGFIPAAVLAALITPALFSLDGSIIDTVVNLRTVAGTIALVVAWRTGSMIATIGAGMAVLWAGSFLL